MNNIGARYRNEPDNPIRLSTAVQREVRSNGLASAEATPHYVLSSTLTSAHWPKTRFIRGIEDVSALKRELARTSISWAAPELRRA